MLIRRTAPLLYDDFKKSPIKEILLLKDLVSSKILYIGLFQSKNGKENFLGDFCIDLGPYYVEGI